MTGQPLVDLIGIPVLMKAVDFLFDLAKERAKQEDADTVPPKPPASDIAVQLGQDQSSLYRAKVNAELLKRYEAEIEALLQQVQIHQNNLNLAVAQKSKWGQSLVPPIIENNIRDEQEELTKKSRRLGKLLELLISIPTSKTEADRDSGS